jgi:hypothetical protein
LIVPLLVTDQAFAASATLKRDVGDYFALSFRRMRLKDFYIEAPGCNLGVNCPETGRTCGRLKMNGAVVSTPGQIVGDDMCGPGSFYEVFRNNSDATCDPNCSQITNKGPGPQCANTFTGPILGDLDNDGQPSCSNDCVVDIGDAAAACGVQYPLPPCDLSKEVRVFPKSDCSPLDYDAVPGNGVCDLKLGTYGNIKVRNRARINFAEGTTVACMLAVGKATRVTSEGPALILVPGYGKASFNNLADVGGECREFKVVTEFGPVRFAKHGEFHCDACTLGGTMKLGHDNNLRGRFISGEFLVSNFNSTGACCQPTTTSTSTSTSTTSSSSSTTTTSIPNLPGVCCEDLSEVPPICGSAASNNDCLGSGGTPGPAGSTCQEAPEGGGRCSEAPPLGGGCCEFADACAIGVGGGGEAGCTNAGGTFVDNAVCLPDGRCEEIPPPGDCCQIGDTCSALGPEQCSSAGGSFVENASCFEGSCISFTTTTTLVSTTSTTTSTTSSSTTSTSSTTSSTSSSSTTSTSTTSSTTTSTAQSGVCCEFPGEPSTCGSAVNNGACVSAGGTPGQPGDTCQASPNGGVCAITPPPPGGCCELGGQCSIGELDATECANQGGTFVDDAVCLPDGRCQENPPPPGDCCELPNDTCSMINGTECVQQGGTLVQNAICRADGHCEEVPPPGDCCELANDTCSTIGPEQCSSLGGSFVENASCLSDGHCVVFTTTTTSTSIPTTSSSTNTTATSVTSSSATVTTVPTTSTTTLPGQGFTRTLGFYKTHPGVTQYILDQVGGIDICGIHLDNTNVDDAQSALEALCISPKGDTRLQLVRQLTAAALTMAAGGATYADFDTCNNFCTTSTGSIFDVGDCINSADAFNNSGDNLPAPFDGVDSGAPEYCQIAHNTACEVLDPATCSN